MRETLALARAELARWKSLWWTGIALHGATWLAPLFPQASSVDPAELRAATAMVVLLVLGVLVPVLVGASMVSNDLAEGRFGFFASLPVGAGKIWLAKLTAGALSTYGVLTIVGLPMLGHGGPMAVIDAQVSRHLPSPIVWEVMLFVGPLLLLLFSNLVAIAYRDRSLWLAVDLGGLIAATWLMWAAVARLVDRWAPVELVIAIAIAITIATLGLGVAGWRQLADGGVELRRSHAVAAAWGWGALLLASTATFAWQGWATNPAPRDIRSLASWAATSTSDEWTVVSGELAGRPSFQPTFLLAPTGSDPRGRDWYRIDLTWMRPSYATSYSRDESTAAVARVTAGTATVAIWRRGTAPYDVPIASLSSLGRIALSDDGSILAVVGPARVELYELPEGRLLGAAQLDTREADLEPYFVGDRLRVVAFGGEDAWPADQLLRVAEVSLDPLAVVWTSPASGIPQARSFVRRRSPDGRQLLTADLGIDGQTIVRDGRSGLALWRADHPEWRVVNAAYLDSGQLVTFELERDESLDLEERARRVRHLDVDGTELGVWPLDDPKVLFGGPIGGTVRLLGFTEESTELLVLDLQSGRIESVSTFEGRLRPVWATRLVTGPSPTVFEYQPEGDAGFEALVTIPADEASMRYLTGPRRGAIVPPRP